MKRISNLQLTRPFCSTLLFLLTSLVISTSGVAADKTVQQINRGIQSLQATSNGKVVVSRKNKSPYVSFLRADSKTPIVDVSVSRVPDVRAKNFLRSQRSLFVDNSTTLDLVTEKVQQSQGHSIVRIQQFYNGIPVRGGEAVVQLNNAGITMVNAKFQSGLGNMSTQPAVNGVDALVVARNKILALYGVSDAVVSEPVLEIFNESSLTGESGPSQLAWFIEATGTMLREYIWVDAQTGSLLKNFSQIARSHMNRNTFDAQNVACNVDAPSLERTEVFPVGGLPVGVPEIDLTHDLVKSVYDFYLLTLGRDGFNDDSGAIETQAAIVNVCTTLSPAFDIVTDTVITVPHELAAWNGIQMLFATGYATDDLLGHEYTHAVIENSANFNLLGESGALAEAFADAIGETIDLDVVTTNDGTDTAWDIGEDSGTTFRNLMDPVAGGFPAKMTDITYCGPDDDVFIHTNSTVLSHAFALLAQGGVFNSVTVTGISPTRAAIIFYEGLKLLTATSQFKDASNALRAAADTLLAATTITLTEKTQLNDALDAVELDVVSPCTSQQIAYCPVGQIPQFLFFDNFEDSGSGNWTSTTGSGITNHWNRNAPVGVYSNLDPRTGIFSLYGNTALNNVTDEIGRSSAEMSNVITLPASGSDIRMQFEHNYQFDTSKAHGGIVEFKLGSAAYADVGTLITQGGYNGQINVSPLGPIGMDAFVGYQFEDLNGDPLNKYGSTQLNLSAFFGQGIQFRFTLGRDKFSNARGWLIDDFAIYTCESQAFVLSTTTDLTTNETGSTALFDFSLASQPLGPVVINFTSSDTSEGIVTPASITFTTSNWDVPQTITTTGQDDSLEDGDIAYTVTASVNSAPVGSVFENVADVIVQITNVDDDAAVAPSGGGGGGCSLSTRPTSFDPFLPMLLMLSFVYVISSRTRRSPISRV